MHMHSNKSSDRKCSKMNAWRILSGCETGGEDGRDGEGGREDGRTEKMGRDEDKDKDRKEGEVKV